MIDGIDYHTDDTFVVTRQRLDDLQRIAAGVLMEMPIWQQHGCHCCKRAAGILNTPAYRRELALYEARLERIRSKKEEMA